MIKKQEKYRADLICLANETFDENKDMVLFDPNETWKRTRIVGGTYTMRKLLVPIFEEEMCIHFSECYGNPVHLYTGKSYTMG